jgi:mRNA interferase RelE/StbE
MKTIIYARAAEKELFALPLKAQEVIEAALDAYAMTGQGDVKRMKSRPGYRLRVGDYRIVFHEDRMTILAVYIGRRNEATYRSN